MECTILAIVDGSSGNENVYRWTCSLASLCKSRIEVQALIDDRQILRLTGYDGQSGLCGSGVFIAAQQVVIGALTELYESIMLSFCARIEGELKQQTVSKFIDVGDAQESIEHRARQADLLIVAVGTASIKQLQEISKQAGCPVLIVDNNAQKLVMPSRGIRTTELLVVLLNLLGKIKTRDPLPFTA